MLTLRALLACFIAFSFSTISQAAKPNVLLIYTDDQGFGDASCLNAEAKFETPHLDRLAREGLSFTDAHCSDTVCTPSRYGLLTGRYCWRTTLKRGVMGAEGKCLIDDGRMTLASLLRDHGYATAMVGKWHLGMDFPGDKGLRDWSQPTRDMPLDKGFEYFYGIPASMNYGVLAWFEGRFATVPPTLLTAKKPNKIALQDYRIMPPYASEARAVKAPSKKQILEVAPDFVDSECLTRFTDKAIEWLGSRADSSDDKPFFLYLPYTSPHKPVIPLPKFQGQSEAGAYGDFMIETDYHVGRILDFMDQQQLTENTLVIVTSDNGPENTWRERIEKFGHDSNSIYREGKRSIYEGGHRVPFLVRWPHGISDPGRTVKHPICQTDILATFADLLGADLPDEAGEDSVSFLAMLRDENYQVERAGMVHHSISGRYAIRQGKWKLVMPEKKSHSIELYDLSADPSETRNLAGDNADLVKRMTQTLTEIVCRGRTTAGKSQSNDTDYWEDLRWLTKTEYRRKLAL